MKKAHKICPKRKRQRGFTIMELMITVALVAVLASIAAPSMRTYVLNNRITGTAQELLRTLQTARGEATKRQKNVVVCASANPTGTVPVCTLGTASGWIMFEDTDGNWARKITAPIEPVIEAHSFDSNKLYMLADNSKRLAYLPTGFASPAGTDDEDTQSPSTSVVICDYRGNVDSNGETTATNSVARGFIIAETGRVRTTRTLADIDSLLTDDVKINASCPP